MSIIKIIFNKKYSNEVILRNKLACCHIQKIYDHTATLYYGNKFVVASYARIGTLSLILDISLSCVKENGFITCK